MNIEINGQIFEYFPEDLSYENSQTISKEDAKENLLILNDIAKKHNFKFLIFYGTLLGAVREHDFIEYDIDIDTVVTDEEELLRMIPIFQEAGFSFIRYEKITSLKSFTTLYSFKRKSVYFDVYVAYDEGRKYNLLGTYFSKKLLDETEQYEFLGANFIVPVHRIKILELYYGKDWCIPKRNCPGYVAPSVLLSTRIKNLIKRFIPNTLIQRVKKILRNSC